MLVTTVRSGFSQLPSTFFRFPFLLPPSPRFFFPYLSYPSRFNVLRLDTVLFQLLFVLFRYREERAHARRDSYDDCGCLTKNDFIVLSVRVFLPVTSSHIFSRSQIQPTTRFRALLSLSLFLSLSSWLSLRAGDLIPRGRRSFCPRHRCRVGEADGGGGGGVSGSGGGGLGDGGVREGSYRQKDLHGGSTASQIT